MKSNLAVLKVLTLATALSVPGLVSADQGGIPNAAACNPGNASFCREDPPNNNQVPEISMSGLPVALGLAATLVLLIRERKRTR